MQPPMLHHAAVLGSPIAHSLSPVIHNTAYRILGLEQWQYSACDVQEHQLADFIASLDPSWAGLSLTMPLKQTIMDMGDPSNVWAEKLGVGNTAIFTWVHGSSRPRIAIYNTDVAGIYMALQHASHNRAHSQTHNHNLAQAYDGMVNTNAQRANISTFGTSQPRALIIGSGNTAHSAIAALSTLSCGSVTLAARSVNKAYALAPLAQHFGMDTDVIALQQVVAALIDREYDIVISTLPPHAADGLAHELEQTVGVVHQGARHAAGRSPRQWGTLLDVAYAPHPTALVQAWNALGGCAVGGEEMLLFQALPQLSYMTGIALEDMPITLSEQIRQTLQEVLQ